MDFFFRHINSNTQVSAGEINSLPFPLADKDTANTVSKLVTKILAAHRPASGAGKCAASAGQADTSALEQEIDALVYQLYGLSPEEIAIVENKT